jgi:hypothetical protein
MKYKGNYDVEILVGGEELPMVPFVGEIAENVLVGLLKSLDGFDPTAEIRITLSPKNE